MSDRLALANAIEDAGIERSKAQRVASVIFDAIHDLHLARQIALQRSPERPLTASAEGSPPQVARQGRWRLLGRPVAAPLALRQHGVGVGVLLEHEAAVGPAFGAAADPVQDPELAQPLQR
jgi:hypothetical protein